MVDVRDRLEGIQIKDAIHIHGKSQVEVAFGTSAGQSAALSGGGHYAVWVTDAATGATITAIGYVKVDAADASDVTVDTGMVIMPGNVEVIEIPHGHKIGAIGTTTGLSLRVHKV